MEFSVFQAYLHQKTRLKQLQKESHRWLEALGWPGEMRPDQWTQLQAMTLEYQPDLILELGRGNGSATACLTQTAVLLEPQPRIFSFCPSSSWRDFAWPSLQPVVDESAFSSLFVVQSSLVEVDLTEVVESSQRVLLHWYDSNKETCETVLHTLLPLLQDKHVCIVLRDSYDTRFYSREYRQYNRNDSSPRTFLNHMDAPASQAVPLLDFLGRNELPLYSGSQEMQLQQTESPTVIRELTEVLGNPWFRGGGSWFWTGWTPQNAPAIFPSSPHRDTSDFDESLLSSGTLPKAFWKQRKQLHKASHTLVSLYQTLGSPTTLPLSQWGQMLALVLEVQPDAIVEIGRSGLASTAALLDATHRLAKDCLLLSSSNTDQATQEIQERLASLSDSPHWLEPLHLHQGTLDSLPNDLLASCQTLAVFWYNGDAPVTRIVLDDLLPLWSDKNIELYLTDVHDLRFHNALDATNEERPRTQNREFYDIPTCQAEPLFDFLHKNHLTLASMAKELSEIQEKSLLWHKELSKTPGKPLYNNEGYWFRLSLRPGQLSPPAPLSPRLHKDYHRLPAALLHHGTTLQQLEHKLKTTFPEKSETFDLASTLQWSAMLLAEQPSLVVELGRRCPELTWCLAHAAQTLPHECTVLSIDKTSPFEEDIAWPENLHQQVGPVEEVRWEEIQHSNKGIVVVWHRDDALTVQSMFQKVLPQLSQQPLLLMLTSLADTRYVGSLIKELPERIRLGNWEMNRSLASPLFESLTKNGNMLFSSAHSLAVTRDELPQWSREFFETTQNPSLFSTGSWSWCSSTSHWLPIDGSADQLEEHYNWDMSLALWNQRELLQSQSVELQRLSDALGKEQEVQPQQWLQAFGCVQDFQPDLVLQIGRGSGIMTVALNAAVRKVAGCKMVSVAPYAHVVWDVLPCLEGVVSEDWSSTLELHVRDPRHLNYDELLEGKERVLLFWNSPDPHVASLVMGKLLPSLQEREHRLYLQDCADLRYSPEELLQYPSKEVELEKQRVKFEHLDAPRSMGVAIADFCRRNRLHLHSIAHEVLQFRDLYGGREQELKDSLEGWYTREGSWWSLTLPRTEEASLTFPPYQYQCSQHPVFLEFDPYYGEMPLHFMEDFIGTRVRHEFLQVDPPKREKLQNYSDYPAMDEEYFEWIDILESALDASEQYVMVELGAGYGRWSGRAAIAAKKCGIPKIYLRPVEADPQYAQNLRQHLLDNGLEESEFDIVQAVVGAELGEVEFYIDPDGKYSDDNDEAWFGQSKVEEYEELLKPEPPVESDSEQDKNEGEVSETEEVEIQYYEGYEILRYKSGNQAIRVPQYPLEDILDGLGIIDLLDLDVQGEEWNVISTSVALLNSRVKRIHIGTHGHELEDLIRELLLEEGWHCVADYTCHETHETPYGEMEFVDGVQSWVNPRLVKNLPPQRGHER